MNCYVEMASSLDTAVTRTRESLQVLYEQLSSSGLKKEVLLEISKVQCDLADLNSKRNELEQLQLRCLSAHVGDDVGILFSNAASSHPRPVLSCADKKLDAFSSEELCALLLSFKVSSVLIDTLRSMDVTGELLSFINCDSSTQFENELTELIGNKTIAMKLQIRKLHKDLVASKFIPEPLSVAGIPSQLISRHHNAG